MCGGSVVIGTNRMQTDNTYTYAGRPVVHRTPMPDGRMLIIAVGTGLLDPWTTGFLGEDNGKYFTTDRAAWRDYAKRMAEGLGLIVAPGGSVVLTPGHIEQVQAQVTKLAKAHDDFEKMLGTDNCDADRRLSAEDGIAEEAMGMADLLRDLGLYKPAEPKDEPDIEAIEPRQYTAAAFVEDVTGGSNWNK